MGGHRLATCGLLVLITAACGQQTPQQEKAVAKGAVTAAAAANAASSPVSGADRAAVLKAASLPVNAQGQVKNECDEMVTPQLIAVDLGSAVGASVLLAMSGGPNLASCYGDGPGLTLFRRAGGGWQEIYNSRGGFLAVMKDQHNGAPDIVFAGPGFSHPAYEWDGSSYAPTKRTVPDDRISDATLLLP